jgi:RES domain-containing protein
MSIFWRISNYADLSGKGGKLAAGRWHSRGTQIVYLADSPAAAMLEQIVHLQDGNGRLPRSYDLLEVNAPKEIPIAELLPPAAAGWKDDIDWTRRLGDAWLTAKETALARVPSAIVPRTWNLLLNPAHPNATRVQIESVIQEKFDWRLFEWKAR